MFWASGNLHQKVRGTACSSHWRQWQLPWLSWAWPYLLEQQLPCHWRGRMRQSCYWNCCLRMSSSSSEPTWNWHVTKLLQLMASCWKQCYLNCYCCHHPVNPSHRRQLRVPSASQLPWASFGQSPVERPNRLPESSSQNDVFFWRHWNTQDQVALGIPSSMPSGGLVCQ